MLLILSVLGLVVFDLIDAAGPAKKYYSSKYEHIDVEAILNNRRMVKYYSACLLSKGPCPPEGVDLKRILPEALQTNCGRCTEKQAVGALRVIKRLQKEYPKIWVQLSALWDPDEVYVKRFESSFASGSSPGTFNNVKPVVITDRFQGDEGSTTIMTNGIDGSATTIITTISDLSTSPATTSTSSSTTVSAKSTGTPSATTKSTSTAPPTRDPFDILLITNPPFRPNASFDFNIGSNIGATVSGLVRGIGALGTRVVETGAEIADVVLRSITRPLSI
uniref:Chemosensory protein n=1 Tax=Cylas formicarius TaxID=197179 RepID=A0A6B7MBN2_CYLFO|nr:chemosensory protein [Cylas formicarius]